MCRSRSCGRFRRRCRPCTGERRHRCRRVSLGADAQGGAGVDAHASVDSGNSASTVFGFGDGVIFPQAGHTLFGDHCIGDIVCQSKADAAAGTRFNEAVHRPGVKRILAVYKFGQQADVPLLRTLFGHQIRQAFPGVQILGADNSGS